MKGRLAGPPVGIAVGPTQFATGRQPGDGLGRMFVDVVRVTSPVCGSAMLSRLLTAVHTDTVGRDRQAGAVAHAGRERCSRPAAGRDPHDGGARRVRVAVVGGDVARRTDGEVHGAIRADGNALQRVCVRATKVGAPGIGQAASHGAAIGRCAVGVVVGVDLVAFGDVERGARERQAVRLIQPVERHRQSGTGAARLGAHHLTAARHGDQQAPVRSPRGQPGLRDAGPHRQRPTRRHQRLARFVERWLGQIRIDLDGDGTRPAGGLGGGCRRRRRVGASLWSRPRAAQRRPATAPIRLCRSQTRMHLPDQNLGGFGGGDALAAGCGEPHSVAFMQRARRLRG